ncbi:MAG: tRNA uridine-5-carboxymethylaminomethyl(34) synthesis enzyme MnmG [Ruminococcaceae bacterium]|nr:tRNA uridine-5-carboxymethylaminomethyl(34) synthesis enzyme MnmG [Oscillospiraceae bacterium]
MLKKDFNADVIVIGAGHAGIEAALASARIGADTVVFTTNLDAVGNMPCNPSVGGSAKGHLVFEIDALGGEMGYAADKATLQSRTLNLGKGAAVHSKRTQADRDAYKRYMKRTLECEQNLRLIQGQVVDILTEGDEASLSVAGIITALGERWYAKKVVIATGTFLDSVIFVGDKSYSAGPDGMMPAEGLSDSLRRLGIELRRFKTGTPARVHRRSIDFSRLEVQSGEEVATPFSVRSDPARITHRAVDCHIVYTNRQTHRIITENLERSAMYSGNIVGTGPRYCPSIETKLVRFADKERHQLFVEPCGADTDEMYIQGFSTSMPTDVQYEMLRSLDGFENAEIMRYAYAIEYDSVDPTELLPTLEFKRIGGLYGAGQFNGTSGYEEAAAQGLVAGANAALAALGRDPLILPRATSYIGTLIDDLVTKGTNEPYRMMTSRSEYRLFLRQDNADVRLTEIGHRIGLISDERYSTFLEKRRLTEEEVSRIEKTNIPPSAEVNELLASFGSTPITTGAKLAELLRRPELSYDALAKIDKERPELSPAIRTTAEITVKYDGYIKRQLAEVERVSHLERMILPPDIDYFAITGLRLEAAEKLSAIRPASIGQASRISGVNPADISVLLIKLGIKH